MKYMIVFLFLFTGCATTTSSKRTSNWSERCYPITYFPYRNCIGFK